MLFFFFGFCFFVFFFLKMESTWTRELRYSVRGRRSYLHHRVGKTFLFQQCLSSSLPLGIPELQTSVYKWNAFEYQQQGANMSGAATLRFHIASTAEAEDSSSEDFSVFSDADIWLVVAFSDGQGSAQQSTVFNTSSFEPPEHTFRTNPESLVHYVCSLHVIQHNTIISNLDLTPYIKY